MNSQVTGIYMDDNTNLNNDRYCLNSDADGSYQIDAVDQESKPQIPAK